ncbi:MAG TPA: aldose 1-epimerase family protein [Rectinemataceae bacterium]|nr:aldose 1-epimerase family protein [Rectinemataceae bacterium]
MTRREILKFVGNMEQVAGITEKTFARGKAKGIASYEVKTGSGLEYTLLPDKCLDIYELRYKGSNISFLAKNGLVASAYGYPLENEFDAYWTAGMLCTCGLMNIGTDCRDKGGRYHPLHGRIGMTPAEQSSARAFWEGDSYKIEASAVMRESMMGQENLSLERTITSSFGSKELVIEDRVTNNEASPVRYMLLYHFNFGFPFIGEDTRLIFPREKSAIVARTEGAKKGLATWSKLENPLDENPEEVFFHSPEEGDDGLVTIKLENAKLGIGVALSYDGATLPVLTQWKSLRSGEYALGIEPGTATLRGRALEEESGNLTALEPFSSQTRRLRLSFYDI